MESNPVLFIIYSDLRYYNPARSLLRFSYDHLLCWPQVSAALQKHNSSMRFYDSLGVRTMTEPRRYRAYLLRLWQADGDDGRPVWRAALEDAGTSERRGF